MGEWRKCNAKRRMKTQKIALRGSGKDGDIEYLKYRMREHEK